MSLDHGMLNAPLAKRGDIDKQIDAYKAQITSDKRAKAKAARVALVSNQKLAKTLLASVSDERINALALRVNQPVAALRKHLASEAHWNPEMIFKLFA